MTAAGGRAADQGAVGQGTVDREAMERRAVEVAYRRFWQVEASFDRDYPPGRWRAVLAAVAVDPVLTRLVAGATVQQRRGITLYGQIVPRPQVGPVLGRGSVRVTDCQDGSRTGQAEAATGRRLSVGVARMPVVATVVRGSDGGWRVAEVRYVGGRC
jgi:hypothetical protein